MGTPTLPHGPRPGPSTPRRENVGHVRPRPTGAERTYPRRGGFPRYAVGVGQEGGAAAGAGGRVGSISGRRGAPPTVLRSRTDRSAALGSGPVSDRQGLHDRGPGVRRCGGSGRRGSASAVHDEGGDCQSPPGYTRIGPGGDGNGSPSDRSRGCAGHWGRVDVEGPVGTRSMNRALGCFVLSWIEAKESAPARSATRENTGSHYFLGESGPSSRGLETTRTRRNCRSILGSRSRTKAQTASGSGRMY